MGQSLEKLRVVVFEDDQPTLNLICSYLSTFSCVEIAASSTESREVENLCNSLNPTAVFMDIEMPIIDGLSTAVKIRNILPEIFIVFVTGHTQYAADAFELDATDYVIKPVTKERLGKAIQKIQRFIDQKAIDGAHSIKKRITVKNSHEIFIIDLNDVFFIEKELRKCKIHTSNRIYVTTEPLHSIELRLSEEFFRCHKSFIINLNKIDSIAPIAERIYKITFPNYPLWASMGRQKMEELCTIIANR